MERLARIVRTAPGPVLAETKVGALVTVVGALLALTAARVLRIGRFSLKPASTRSRHDSARRSAAPRSLAGEQLRYAAADVEVLGLLYAKLRSQVEGLFSTVG